MTRFIIRNFYFLVLAITFFMFLGEVLSFGESKILYAGTVDSGDKTRLNEAIKETWKGLEKQKQQAENILIKERSELEAILKKQSNNSRVVDEARKIFKKFKNSSLREKGEREARKILEEKLREQRLSHLVEEDRQKPTIKKNESKGKADRGRKEYYLVVSSSMPFLTLRNYALQIKKLRQKNIIVHMVLRGFVKGPSKLRPTISWLLSFGLESTSSHKSSYKFREKSIFAGKSDFSRSFSSVLFPSDHLLVDLEINPVLVERARISYVPALYDPQSECVVYGDASLKFLLEKIKVKEGCGKIYGKTYKFAEEDAIKQIYQKLASFDYKKFERYQRELLERKIKKYLSHFHCIYLPPAREDREYFVTPVYTLDFDIPDPRYRDRILYPAGFQFNPLDYASFPGSIILIDGTRAEEIDALSELIKKAPVPVNVFLIQGNYLRIQKMLRNIAGVRLYASCRAVKVLVRDYGVCKSTPCIVQVRGNRFLVKEISVR